MSLVNPEDPRSWSTDFDPVGKGHGMNKVGEGKPLSSWLPEEEHGRHIQSLAERCLNRSPGIFVNKAREVQLQHQITVAPPSKSVLKSLYSMSEGLRILCIWRLCIDPVRRNGPGVGLRPSRSMLVNEYILRKERSMTML